MNYCPATRIVHRQQCRNRSYPERVNLVRGVLNARGGHHADNRTRFLHSKPHYSGVYVRTGARSIVSSRSRAPLFPRDCETGTVCPCICARLGPCTWIRCQLSSTTAWL